MNLAGPRKSANRGNIKVVRTRPALNFTLPLKIFKSLRDLRDLCVSERKVSPPRDLRSRSPAG